MLFLLALAISILFVCFLDKALKAHPYHFYIGAAMVTIIIFLCDFSAVPAWINKWIIGLFSKGAMGTALFVIVMYTGALKNGTKQIGKLMRIRGELSIFAAILVLAHNLTYGKIYFKYLFQKPEILSNTQLAAAIISIILITLMVILTVTSFPQVRKKMKPKSWKKLQRSAYVFYGLVFVHILLINIPYARRGMNEYIFNVAVYSIVFISYGVKRIRKYLLAKNRNKIKENAGIEKKINISAVIINVFVVICVVMFALPARKNEDTVYAYKSAKKDSLSAKEEDTSYDGMDNEENTTWEGVTKNPDESSSQSVQQPENQLPQNSGVEAGKDNLQSSEETQEDVTEPQATQESTVQESTTYVQTTYASTTNTPITQPAEPQETTTYKEQETTAKRTYKKDGEYSGKATVDEFEYDVSVTITIKEDKISNVVIKTFEEFFEDEEYAYKAASGLKSQLTLNQGTDGVDGVSGATYTSKAIFRAFNSALEDAKN